MAMKGQTRLSRVSEALSNFWRLGSIEDDDAKATYADLAVTSTVVSRAFQILSDADKKAKFDRFGGDPDNRFGGGSAPSASSPFSGFARSPSGGGRMYEEEISPDELFNRFFGGGMGGGFGPFGIVALGPCSEAATELTVF